MNVRPPLCETYTAGVTAGPVKTPSSQTANRSAADDALSVAGPPALTHGGVHFIQRPSLPRRAPVTITVRLFASSHPSAPENTSCADGTGPAPRPIARGSIRQTSELAGADQIANAGFRACNAMTYTSPRDTARSNTSEFENGASSRCQLAPPSSVS